MGKGEAGSPLSRPSSMGSRLEPPPQPFMVHDKMLGLGPGSIASAPANWDGDTSSPGTHLAYAAQRLCSDAAATHGTTMGSVHGVTMDIKMQEKMKSDLPRVISLRYRFPLLEASHRFTVGDVAEASRVSVRPSPLSSPECASTSTEASSRRPPGKFWRSECRKGPVLRRLQAPPAREFVRGKTEERCP